MLLVARSYLVLVVETVVILLQPMWRHCSHMKYRLQPLSILPGFCHFDRHRHGDKGKRVTETMSGRLLHGAPDPDSMRTLP